MLYVCIDIDECKLAFANVAMDNFIAINDFSFNKSSDMIFNVRCYENKNSH